jgi:aminopeptidase
VSCKAKVGGKTLEKMLHMDEGAAMLGEVALVSKESPINRSGLLFCNTLFDENACCHVAAGQGFGEVLECFLEMSREELTAKGINDSMIHVDYMVGADDLSITGVKADGTRVKVFENGTWAD